MTMRHARGAVQWLGSDGVSTTYAVSGLGFQPQIVRAYTIGAGSAVTALGQQDLVINGSFFGPVAGKACISSYCRDNIDPSEGAASYRTDCIAAALTGAAGTAGRLDIDSWNSDGFVLIVDEQLTALSQLTIMFDAWTDDAETWPITIGLITEPAATGTQQYTATGFTTTPDDDQVVMSFGCQSSSAANAVANLAGGLSYGFATGPTSTDHVGMCNYQNDGGSPAPCRRYAQTGEFLVMNARAASNTNGRASFNAFLANQFELNWLERATTGRSHIYCAIKGGKWRAGALAMDSRAIGNTVQVTGLPFVLQGFLLMCDTVNMPAADVSNTQLSISMGSGKSLTDRAVLSAIGRNNAVPTVCIASVRYDAVNIGISAATGSLLQTFDIDSIVSDGFTLIVEVGTDSDTAQWLGYLAFGDLVPAFNEVLLGQQLT